MHSDLAGLNKILRDGTRRQIIILLHDRTVLTYSDLQEALHMQDRGRLNYHLKTLVPLLNKTDNGYSLSEQGTTTWKMLQDFSYNQKTRLATTIKYGRNAIALGLVAIYFLTYHQHLTFEWLLGTSITLCAISAALVVFVKVQSSRLGSCRSTDTSLLETLNDKTRRKIVDLLRENGRLSYTELMKAAKVDSSGQMNYHLKALSSVVSVDETGQYTLTKKGVFAYNSQRSIKNANSMLKINPLWHQWFAIALVSALMLAANFLLYTRGAFSSETAAINVVIVAFAATAMLYLAKVNDDLKLYQVKNTNILP
ncbi:MAG: helix-turn-helix domain-containing protein [Candidatus Bathyarchaeota archaeon]|nr:helix-turn-helix domain-containing protein [Candidatus Bathyarchaeota archaeon]